MGRWLQLPPPRSGTKRLPRGSREQAAAPSSRAELIREGSLRDPPTLLVLVPFSVPLKMGQPWLGAAEWPLLCRGQNQPGQRTEEARDRLVT